MKEELIKEFKQRYNKNPGYLFFCPGRVNLIGEHIDYNGGRVLPCAISRGIGLAAAKNNDGLLRFAGINFPETAEIPLSTAYSKTGKEWFNYPLGVFNELLKSNELPGGLDLLYLGDLPVAAGLSSSAAIEVLTAWTLSGIFDLGLERTAVALMAKKVENEFIGVNSGIMDQFAVAMGKKDQAILLDCDTLEYEYIPFRTGNYQLVIINSNKQRALAESKYNERFSECRQALKMLQAELDILNLCDIDLATFEKNKQLITDPTLQKRALHVVSENARVKDAVIALQTGDMEVFGKLMYASHQSLKDLYEVSGKELDTIVEFCSRYRGCIGGRMTGAGFGGCAIALVQKQQVGDFTTKLEEYYTGKIGYAPEIFPSDPEEGVHQL
jgi:galactokinase